MCNSPDNSKYFRVQIINKLHMFNAVLGILHDRVLQQAEYTAAVHADYHYTHCINSFKLTSAARKTILIAGMDTAKNIWDMIT